MINAAQFVDAMSQDFKQIFLDDLKAREPYYDKIFLVQGSGNQYEKLSGITGVQNLATKTEGSPMTEIKPYQKYDKTFTHTSYGGFTEITHEAMNDDRSGKLRGIPKMHTLSGIRTVETIAAAHFDRSQTAAYTGPDGKVLCATDHPRAADGGTWSNRPSTNADLGVAVLESALTDYENTPDDNNNPTVFMPTMLLINGANRFMAAQLLENLDKTGTANRDINAIKNQYSGLRMFVDPYLTDTDAWYLLCPPSERQLIWFWREKLATDMYPAYDKTKNAIFESFFRASSGWVDARGIYGSSGA